MPDHCIACSICLASPSRARSSIRERRHALNTNRTEAFSDGVFAIAATLLVLELKIPHVEPGGLSEALLESWPSYATYVVSFLTIGIIWVNHHAVMERIKNVNRPLLFLNLVFLMAVAAIPFPTALLADYLQAGHDERLASAIYGTTMALMGVTFGLIWAYAVFSDDLLHDKIDPDRARRSLLMFAAGNPLYLLAIGVSFLSAELALAIYALLALFYLFDVLPPLQERAGKQG
jgi:TMEM175 potassium channel family protein